MKKRNAKFKGMAEGGEVKKGMNDTQYGLAMLSPAYAISQMASGKANLGDFGLMGMMDRFSGNEPSPQDSEAEKARKKAIASVGGAGPTPGMKRGGMVKKTASRGDGIAARGKTKGRMV
jgi:hypothetical protein